MPFPTALFFSAQKKGVPDSHMQESCVPRHQNRQAKDSHIHQRPRGDGWGQGGAAAEQPGQMDVQKKNGSPAAQVVPLVNPICQTALPCCWCVNVPKHARQTPLPLSTFLPPRPNRQYKQPPSAALFTKAAKTGVLNYHIVRHDLATTQKHACWTAIMCTLVYQPS